MGDPDKAGGQRWRDAALPVAARVEALIAAMTLEEKVAQLGSFWFEEADGDAGADVAPPRAGSGRRRTWEEASAHGLGQLTRVFGTRPLSAAAGARRLAELQRDLVARTRLGVPAIAHEEALCGFMALGATAFPSPLALAATFNPDLVERMAVAIGEDLRRAGVHQALAPLLDVTRDYRWGRVEETYGEDPYLVGMLGSAFVRGIESTGVVATLKHFAGYSASRAGRNHAPVSIGPRELADIVLAPFEMALRDGGARSVMNSYADLDGMPPAADRQLLTGLLREAWGFDGVVVSDYGAIGFLATAHGLSETAAEAGALALDAGIDVELPETDCYGPALAALVRDGRVPEAAVDRAVGRVLRQKAELGLLDRDFSAAGVEDEAALDLDSSANRRLSRELAEQSVILLANDGGLLPLAEDVTELAVLGPCADDPRTLLGCYSFPNHVLSRRAETDGGELGIDVCSLLDALRTELPAARARHAAGCSIDGVDRSGFAEAIELARGAELVVVCVGDRAGLFGSGTSGEGNDAEDLSLPGVQGDLVDAVLAVGKPVALVVVSGRPYALGAFAGRADVMIQAFFPGAEGGAAIAGVLSGRVTPSGKLPVQISARPGGQPGTYLNPPLGAAGLSVSSIDGRPLHPFGHGLSYTRFAYRELSLSRTEIATDGELTVSCTVLNAGTRAGAEVVQLYLEDPVAEVTRPVIQLLGFQRVALEPGRHARVTFRVHADRLSYTGRAHRRIVDAGEVGLLLASSSQDVRLRARVSVTGPTRTLGPERTMITGAEVRLGP